MKKISHSIHNTDNDWVVDYNSTGISGYKFTSKEDDSKYIFLPVAGMFNGLWLTNAGFGGAYWLRTLYAKYPNDAFLLLAAGSLISEHSERSIGMAVRPVITP